MAAETRIAIAVVVAIALGALHGIAAADSSDAAIIGAEPGWRVEDVELRTTYLDQRGRGFQSQDDVAMTGGGQGMYILQPSALIRLRQSARVTHEVYIPVDAITAASPDAVDAMSSASRRNTAFDIDLRTTIKLGDHDTLTTRAMAHGEEPMGGGTLGAGYVRSLADDNATIGVNGSLTIDGFDDHDHFGNYLGKTARETANANISASQLLSPTTVVDASYGITYQHGTLKTTWNAVPTAAGRFTDEVVPRDRVRNAVMARIAQHVPLTHSTVKASYRAYIDDWGVRAHTLDTSVYQYIVPWLYLRGGFRFHHQLGPDFFTTSFDRPIDSATLRTSDSDLATMNAYEWTLQLVTLRGRGPLGAWSASGELFRYTRSNDLQITAVSIGVGRAL